MYHQCQTVWIQIMKEVWSCLIWVQTVFKSNQQTTLVGKEFNVHVQLSNGTRGLVEFSLSIYLFSMPAVKTLTRHFVCPGLSVPSMVDSFTIPLE